MNLPRPVRALVCSAVAACALSASEAQAGLLVYEPFDYPASSTLNGANGGDGFANAWWEDDGFPLDVLKAGSLLAPNAAELEVAGNFLQTTHFTTASRTFSDPLTPEPLGDALWFSFLIRKDAHHRLDSADTFELTLSSDPEVLSSLSLIDTYDGQGAMKFGIRSGNSAVQYVQNSGSRQLGIADFVVVKVTFLPDITTRMDLFVNPDLTTVPTQADASITSPVGGGLPDITRMQIANDRTRAQWSFDEFRAGTTYDSVTPASVPEPGSALLLGFGLAGLGMKRFRRMQQSVN